MSPARSTRSDSTPRSGPLSRPPPSGSRHSSASGEADADSTEGGPSRTPSRRRNPDARRRRSKACEQCRLRRIKCSGPPPCHACVESGVGADCFVRVKARPQRAISSKLLQLAEMVRGEGERGAADEPLRSIDEGPDGAPAMSPNAGDVADPIPDHLPDSIPDLVQSVVAAPIDSATRRQRVDIGRISPAPSSPALFSESNPSPASFLRIHTSPLDEVEDALCTWCTSKDIPLAQLVFKINTRLSGTPGTDLPQPPELYAYEDSLVDYFMTSPEVGPTERLRLLDTTYYLGLYARHRALPHSLSEDQTAIIYGVLCLARFAQIRADINNGTPLAAGNMSREDITYFHLACDALKRWGRPSMSALRALFCLNSFTIGIGGPAETKAIMNSMAWQIRELGLNQQFTASMYDVQEQVGLLYSNFFYTDLFCASLTDMSPCIPIGESTADPTPPVTLALSRPLVRCSYFTAKFLSDYADPSVDMTTLEYAAATEGAWAADLRWLRVTGKDKVRETGWAEFRYAWLRILLYLPLLKSNKTKATAYAAIARSVSMILYTYVDLAAANHLNPSWPQLQRLVVCGQLLVLCHEAGELQKRESRTLFRMLVDILGKHQDTWPICGELVLGYTAAAQVLGLDISPMPSAPYVVAEVDADEVAGLESFQWTDLGLDFDFSSFPL